MTDSRQNLVLVSIDSLRADHCGYLGDDRGLTPTLDEMAGDGVAFEAAVAPGPQTFSSMPAVFTGVPRPADETLDGYPGDSHWERRLAAVDEHLARHPSLPERLRERGYATAGFSPNPWTSTASGFDRGFDRFVDVSGHEGDGRLRRLAERAPLVDTDSKRVELALDALTGSSFFASWESFYDRVDAARRRLPEPYFLWVFLLDTHFPFLPGRAHRVESSLFGSYLATLRSEGAMRGDETELSPSVGEAVRRSYRDTVRAVDAFLDRLRADAAGDDPAIVVHADHGESFGEHGNYGHHHREVYEENVHVPYVVDGVEVTARVTDPTSLTTIPDLALSLAEGGRIEVPELTGSRRLDRAGSARLDRANDAPPVARSECGAHRAVRGRRYKCVDGRDATALYDLRTDPDETEDVAAANPELVRGARERLARAEGHADEHAALAVAARVFAAHADW